MNGKQRMHNVYRECVFCVCLCILCVKWGGFDFVVGCVWIQETITLISLALISVGSENIKEMKQRRINARNCERIEHLSISFSISLG